VLLNLKKPIYHLYLKTSKLTPSQRSVLKNNLSFYIKLSQNQQCYVEHRVASFISNTFYVFRNEVVIGDEKKVLIAAIVIMLTFDFKSILFSLVETIIVYPEEYYSNINMA
jgi:Mlc titration factor MtfA (ptsG expression regulator)